MADGKTCIELSSQDWELVEAALQTQEKIMSLQSRAGSNADKIRLNELQSLQRRLRRQNPDKKGAMCRVSRGWSGFARALFG